MHRITLIYLGVALLITAGASALAFFVTRIHAQTLIFDAQQTLTIEYTLIGLVFVLSLGHVYVSYRSLRREDDLVRMKSDFIAVSAHELRSPLTALRWTLAELQKDTSLSPVAHATVNQLYERVRALIDLTSTFLIASSTDHGVMRPDDLKVVNITPTILTAIQHSTELARTKNIKINTLFSLDHASQIIVKADAERLRLVFENLLSNAIKYSPQGSSVDFAYEDRIHTRVFTIRDHGIGIPPQYLKTIFTGFQRAENAKKSGIVGSGFGLYMVKKIIDFHGGTVSCTSVQGAGTTFTFNIPSGV